MKRVLVVACLAAFGVVVVLLVGGDSQPASPVTDSSARIGSQTSHAPETHPLEVPMESIPFEGPLSDSGKGHVVIQFLAADGGAVPGITAKIGDELRVSDKAGRAAWELDAGRYTWTHVGDEHLELNPPPRPPVTPHVRQDGAIGWRTESKNVARKESGEFVVEASKTLDLKVLVHRGTSVIGQIPITERFPSWETRRQRIWHDIRLVRPVLHVHPNDPNERVLAFRQLGSPAVVDDSGAFEFKDIPPGEFVIEAWWRPDPENYYVHRSVFRVEPGGQHYLGVLRHIDTMRAISVQIRSSGEIVDPEAVLGPLLQPIWVRLSFDVNPGFHDVERSFYLTLDVEFGSARIHGLPPEVNAVHVIDEPTWPRALNLQREIATIDESRVRVVYPLSGPKTANPTVLRVDRVGSWYYFLSRKGHPTKKGWLESRTTLDLEPGDHELFMHTQRATMKAVPQNIYFLGTVLVEPGEEILVTPIPGATYRGVVLNRDGTPYANSIQSFRPPGSRDWSVSTQTGADGSFHLIGMPYRLEAMLADNDVLPGTELVIRRKR